MDEMSDKSTEPEKPATAHQIPEAGDEFSSPSYGPTNPWRLVQTPNRLRIAPAAGHEIVCNVVLLITFGISLALWWNGKIPLYFLVGGGVVGVMFSSMIAFFEREERILGDWLDIDVKNSVVRLPRHNETLPFDVCVAWQFVVRSIKGVGSVGGLYLIANNLDGECQSFPIVQSVDLRGMRKLVSHLSDETGIPKI